MADDPSPPTTGGDILAPAKVNLCLHVTGQRADGYHLLDSLVSFGGAWDRLTIRPAETLSLTVEGPEAAGVPSGMENLVLKAAAVLSEGRGAAFVLEKHMPSASGIGGGSADAAAAIRGVIDFWRIGGGANVLSIAPDDELRLHLHKLIALGADVLMCLASVPLRARRIGDKIDLLPGLPPLPVVLANPRTPVSTPQVFRRLAAKDNPGLPETLPDWPDVPAFCDWLATTRNDLEAPAIALEPQIARVRDTLAATEGALFARMSGSGATCFAVYPDLETAEAARWKLAADHPGWWLSSGMLGNQSAEAAPRFG